MRAPARAIGVQLLLGCLVLGQASPVRAEDADHDARPNPTSPPPPVAPPSSAPSAEPTRRPRNEGPPHAAGIPREFDDGCRVSPQRLADFANGESYDFNNLVNYLTAPACIANARQISRAAINSGVSFSSVAPYRLDNFAKGSHVDLESSTRLESSLARTIPNLLRENPLGPNELLPIMGQLALLSPKAARAALTNLIQQEVFAGDQRILLEDSKGKLTASAELARTLVRLGAAESLIASDIASSVEEMTVLRRSDSLARFLRGLGAAANVEASLVPTFNLSAGAVSRAVRKSQGYLQSQDREDLMFAVFIAVRAAMAGSGALEPGAAELNEALGTLIRGTPLVVTSLRKLWKDVTRVLAQSGSQTALADAVAASLTPNLVYLNPTDRDLLLAAARNYAQISSSIQVRFLQAWFRLSNRLRDGNLEPRVYNRMRRKYFEPIVAAILELDPSLVDAVWLREALAGGLIQDDDIEKRFPRFVLAYLDRREKASKVALADAGLEPTLSSMAESFAVVWTLSNVHIPALMRWVKKYEQ
jgi:hypothetical protein